MRHTARSAAQNRYLFGVVYPAIRAKTGRTVEEIHDLCTLWFLPQPTIRKVSNESGDVRVITRAVAHTSQLSPAAFAQFVDDVRTFAKSCLGVETDDPGYWRFGPS